MKDFVDTIDVFFDLVRENDDFSKIGEASWPFKLCKYDVGGVLKGCSGVREAEWHSNILTDSVMSNNPGLRSIFFSNIRHPLARVRIRRRDHSRLS